MKNGILIFTILIAFTACNKKNADKSDNKDIPGDSINVVITNSDSGQIKETTEQTEENKQPEKTEPVTQKDDMQSGTIILKADTWIIRETAADGTITDYYAENLGAEFKKEGLKVRFKGNLGEIPKNVRMIGRPITLTKIEKA